MISSLSIGKYDEVLDSLDFPKQHSKAHEKGELWVVLATYISGFLRHSNDLNLQNLRKGGGVAHAKIGLVKTYPFQNEAFVY